uniref:Secreted protein n=1 Tax=Ascaris lumbricoides TaxID=6252 RepID=A0A0M3IE06_ASCLU
MLSRSLCLYVAFGVLLCTIFHQQLTEAFSLEKRTFLPYHRLNLKISPKFIDYLENALNERHKYSSLQLSKRSTTSMRDYDSLVDASRSNQFDDYSTFI